MARQTAGFMGGFHGRLGPAVGYMWRGVWCVRSYNPHPRNPRTEAQTAHREMFKREVQLASYMSWAVNLGFRDLSYENGMTPYNMFVHLNQHAFSLVERDRSGANQPNEGGAGIFTVDYSALRLCSGPVAGVTFGAPVWGEGNVLTITFDRDGSTLRGDKYDSVYLYAYCPDMEDGFLAAPVYRRTRKITVALPDSYAGHEVHLYGMIVNEEGEWSETIYAGCVNSEEGGVRNEELAEPTERAAQNGRGPTEMDEGARAESRRDGTGGGGGGGTPLGLT